MKKRMIAGAALLTVALLTACTGDNKDEAGKEASDAVELDINNGTGSGESGTVDKDTEKDGDVSADKENEEKEGGSAVVGTIKPVDQADPVGIKPDTAGAVSGEELLCLAADEKEAQAIADQYGITLVNFNNGVATFTTDEDIQAVIQRGIDNGYPVLDRNDVIYLTDPVTKPVLGDTFTEMIGD
ncbi:MAG: hypothetical protein J6X66_08450 [Lachnospiraceae bacterium]|nr:hypothetical protein [Lachnospiraceae bacterium]